MEMLQCPSREDLRRFVLGLGDDSQASQVQNHLAGCPACLSSLESLRDDDPLIDAVKAAPGAPATDDRAVAELMDYLSRLRYQPGEETEATCASETRSLSPEKLDFLEPPLEPGDLGQLGSYRIIKTLGSGGMGIVFEAEDTALQRHVALKVMRPHATAHPLSKERFLREARMAASIEHENIVPIYQVGEERGIAFLAQRLLKGESLDDKLKREGALPTPDVLRIGREIAAGLQAAHERGLVHRDIKPANIWIEAGSSRVKLLDFGLARPLEDASLTRTGEVAGTPQYMAPEQAAGQAVDPRCDLFSLGCVLYRATTGKLPFAGRDVLAVLRALAVETPARPEAVQPRVPAPLADLIMQLLSKEPQGRPATAAVVAERLEAIAAGKSLPAAKLPERARPAWPYLIATAAALLLLVGGILNGPAIYRFTTNQGIVVVETSDPDIEVTVTQNGQRIAILDKTNGHRATIKAGRYEAVIGGDKGWTLLTDRFTLSRGGEEVVKVRLEPAKLAQQEKAASPSTGNYRKLLDFKLDNDDYVAHVAYSPDNVHALVVNGGPPGGAQPEFTTYVARIWDLHQGKEVSRIPLPPKLLKAVVFTVGGKTIMTAGYDGSVRQWAPSGHQLKSCIVDKFSAAAFDVERKRFLLGTSLGQVQLWDFEKNEKVCDLLGHSQEVIVALAFSADGHFALSGGGGTFGIRKSGIDCALRLWDLRTKKEVCKLQGHTDQVRYVAFSKDGATALSSAFDDTLIHWDLKKREVIEQIKLDSQLQKTVVSPDFSQVLVVQRGGVRRIDLRIHREVGFLPHPSVTCLEFSPDSTRVLLGDRQGRVQELELGSRASSQGAIDPQEDAASTGSTNRRPTGLIESPLSPHPVGGQPQPLPKIPRFKIVLENNYNARVVALSPDNRRALVVNGQDPTKSDEQFKDYSVRVWDLQTQTEIARIPSEDFIDAAAFSESRDSVLFANTKRYHASGVFSEWSLKPLKEIRRKTMSVGFKPVAIDSRRHRFLAATHFEPFARLQLWDLEGNRLLHELDGHLPEAVVALALSRDGRVALAGGGGQYGKSKSGVDFDLRLWDLRDGSEICRLAGHTDQVRNVAFSADGREAVSSGFDKTLIHWDLVKREIIKQMPFKDGIVELAAASNFGHVLLANHAGMVRLIDLRAHKEVGHFPVTEVRRLSFSADGKYAIAGGGNGVVQILDLSAADAVEEAAAESLSTPESSEPPRKLAHIDLGESRFVPNVYYAPDGVHAAIVNGLANDKEKPRHAVHIWNLAEVKEVGRIPSEDFPRINVFSADSSRLFSMVGTGYLRQCDLTTHQEVRRSPDYEIQSAAFDPVRRRYLCAGPGRIELRGLEDDKLIRNLPNPGDEGVFALAFSADGSQALSGGGGVSGDPRSGADHEIRLWNLAEGTEVGKLKGHAGQVRFVAFSPDGTQALSSSGGDQLIHWDLPDRKIIKQYSIPQISKVAVDANLKTAAVISFGLGVRIVDLQAQREVGFFKRPAARGLDLSSDGRRLLVGDMGGLVQELEVSAAAPIRN